MYNILLCDDEKDIISALKIYLRSDSYTLFEAYDGQQALEIIRSEQIHLVLLDIMMPGIDGIQALSMIREISNVPILFLTAKSEETDKILGLTVGADDYITKPFNPVELQARVKSHLRRYMQLGAGQISSDQLRVGGIELNDRAKSVTLDGSEVNLTRTEYEILRFLMQNRGIVYSPKEIYRAVWGEDPFGAENLVAVHIRHLREKLEYDPSQPRYIKVVWGHGYKMA